MTPSLTEYAGWLYGQPGVEPLLLELQDQAGADVLLLLVACWLGRTAVPADLVLWQRLHADQTPWREQVIDPLRQVRRALANNTQTAALYKQVKACELAAEWHQLKQLEALCRAAINPPEDRPWLGAMQAHLAMSGEASGDRRVGALAELAVAVKES